MKTNQLVLFRDDELLMVAKDHAANKLILRAFAPGNGNLTTWDITESHERHQNGFMDGDKISIASGRISEPDAQDDVVIAFYDDESTAYQVELYDSTRKIAGEKISETGNKHSSVRVAVGDLDKLVDDSGFYHDEIVLVRNDLADNNYKLHVDVLDQNLKTLASTVVPFGDYALHVAVAIGDFDGDGNFEFATGQTYTYAYQIDVFQFTRDQSLGPSLTWVSTNSFSFYDIANGMRMVAGDFNGDGKDDIAVAGNPEHFDLLASDDKLILYLKKQVGFSLPNGTNIHNASLSIASGLFEFDPQSGFGIARRQLAICQGRQQHTNEGLIRIFSVEDDWTVSKIGEKTFDASSFGFTSHLAAGNFVGHQSVNGVENTSPLMDIAFSHLVVKSGTSLVTPKLTIVGLRDGTLNEIHTWAGTSMNTGGRGDEYFLTALVAFDGNGDTYRLGRPLHITMDNYLSLDYLIQMPPKHVDYLPEDPSQPEGEWKVFNVSGIDEFYVKLIDSKETTLETSSTETSSRSTGGDAELDVKHSVTAGANMGLFNFSSKLNWGTDLKLGYQYEQNKSSYESHYSEVTLNQQDEAVRDDYLRSKVQLVDIWRYPIIGFKTGDPDLPYGFQEIILPGPKETFGGGGLGSDWYQPVHQNHNLLSYPLIDDGFPTDLGSFSYTDASGNQQTKTEIMNDGSILSWDQTGAEVSINWTDTAGAGVKKDYQHTLSESLDVTIGMHAKGEVLNAGKVDNQWELTVGVHNSNSWGGCGIANATSSQSTGITLNKPAAVDGTKSYAFEPVVYVSSDKGAFKVAHAVNPLGSGQGQEWWTQQYGAKPDPALNLPNRFIWNKAHGEQLVDYWTLNEDDHRMEMRGVIMRESGPDPISGEYNILGGPPTDGDVVRLCARVYNFSLHQATGLFNVRFEYISYDDTSGKEMGDRTEIGTVSTSLNSIMEGTSDDPSMKEICVPWATTGLSNTQYSYRFYVTVDPDDEVRNEIHEWKDASGNRLAHGNNEGYWPWGQGITVHKKQSQSAQVLQTSSKPFVSMHIESLAIETPSGLKSKGPVRAFAHERYRLRAHIVANEDHPHHHHTVFFDGPPENGKVIAMKTNWGLIDGDNYVWATWIPEETGEGEIYVHFIEDWDDANKGDAWDSLKVVVREEPISWRDEITDRLMGVEE